MQEKKNDSFLLKKDQKKLPPFAASDDEQEEEGGDGNKDEDIKTCMKKREAKDSLPKMKRSIRKERKTMILHLISLTVVFPHKWIWYAKQGRRSEERERDAWMERRKARKGRQVKKEKL